MVKKTKKPLKTCADCIHEFACGMWNIGYIHNMDATNCTNYETIKDSSSYFIGFSEGALEMAYTNREMLLDAKDIDVPTNRWISVKDRLPEKDENYIVTVCDEGCSAGEGIWYSTVVVVAEYYKGSWTWYDGGHEYSLDGIVTHWQPMPEPPEMGKAEE